MQEKYENALEGDIYLNEKIIKLNESNETAYEALILSIMTSSVIGNVAFRLVQNAKSARLLGTVLYNIISVET